MSASNGRVLRKLQADPGEFRRRLRIQVGRDVRVLEDVLDDWQRRDFEALDPALRLIVTGQGEAPYRRAWIERCRGASKTSDIAVLVTYALFAAPQPISAVVCAADRAQAGLLRNAIYRLVRLNVWLGAFLDVQANRVANRHTGSDLEILSSDVATSWGRTATIAIADELSVWPQAGEELWISLISSCAKVEHGLAIAIQNAGYQDSWQWRLRAGITEDSEWYFSRTESPPSWISQRVLDGQARILPPTAYRRLWQNQWVDSSGDALDPQAIQDSIVHAGPLLPDDPGFADHVYYAAWDLATKRDFAALVVVGVHKTTGRFRVANIRVWKPRDFGRGEVDLAEVVNQTVEMHRIYHFVRFTYDAFQAALPVQILKRYGIPCEEVAFQGKHLNLMAATLVEAFASGQIELYRHEQMLADLRRLRVAPRPYGFRLEADRVAGQGHADAATCLAMILPAAKGRAGGQPFERPLPSFGTPPKVDPARYGIQLVRHTDDRRNRRPGPGLVLIDRRPASDYFVQR